MFAPPGHIDNFVDGLCLSLRWDIDNLVDELHLRDPPQFSASSESQAPGDWSRICCAGLVTLGRVGLYLLLEIVRCVSLTPEECRGSTVCSQIVP